MFTFPSVDASELEPLEIAVLGLAAIKCLCDCRLGEDLGTDDAKWDMAKLIEACAALGVSLAEAKEVWVLCLAPFTPERARAQTRFGLKVLTHCAPVRDYVRRCVGVSGNWLQAMQAKALRVL